MTKKSLVALFSFIGGFMYLLVFFMPPSFRIGGHAYDMIYDVRNTIDDIMIVSAAAAFGLGLIQIFMNHGRRVIRGIKGWHNSLALFVAMFAMLGFGIWSNESDNPMASDIYNIIMYKYFFAALGAAMFSLLSFYIATAAFRSFRVRSFEAGFMMFAALLIMIGQIPVGEMIVSSTSGFLNVIDARTWVLGVVNSAVFRGIYIGMTIASLAIALRIWLGLERGTFFD